MIAPSRAVRSSGCTRSNVAAKSRRAAGSRPNSERPCSVIHTSLPDTSHTHMARFPASAARPIRLALSRNASFERRSSSMTTARSISGVAVTKRNSWSSSAFSAGVWARNGPCPCMVPQIAWNVTINIETLIPPRPKRSAAQISRGIGAYKSSGRTVRTGGRSIECEDSQRHCTPADESRFQHAPRGKGSRAPDEHMMRTQQQYRHQNGGRYRIRDSQVAPFDPIVSAETVGDRKGSPPEGGPKRNDHHGDEDEEHRVAKGDRFQGRRDQNANPRRCQDAFHRVERLAGQGVHRRPVRLLRRQKVSAGGGEYVGPPVASGHEQQDAKQHRLRGKKE